MSSPVPPTEHRAPHAAEGGAWWSARAELASRRARPFMLRWGIAVGALTLVALLAPLVATDPRAVNSVDLERAAADTLRSAQQLRTARAALSAAESALVAARALPPRSPAPSPAAPPRAIAVPPAVPSTVPAVAPPGAGERSAAIPPSIADLTRRIDEARRLRTAGAYLEVAAHPEVSPGPRMRAIADSVRQLAAAPVTAPDDPDGSVRARRLARFGVSIIAMARYRRDALLADAGIRVDSAASGTATTAAAAAPPPTAATVVTTPVPPSAAATTPARDTVALSATLARARDAATAAATTHDSLVGALRALAARAGPVVRPRARDFAPAAGLFAALLLGLALRFGIALRSESRAPTLANAVEAERVTGARALTTVRDALLDGPARFKPSGVDPFRMLYLGLTATGTRARTAVVAGSDAEIVAATGARLAIAAAADHRNTLIVDLDPTSIAVSRTFRERPEPGLSDVMARAFTWREVARPVGSSDGLPITLLPAGTERDDHATDEARAQLLAEFERLRSTFELTLAVAPLGSVGLASELLPSSPIVLTAIVGETSLAALTEAVNSQRAAGRRVAGLVIWDAPRPKLPSRAELAAELSKRKGRTPGGSFEAVRRAIGPTNSSNRKT